MTDTLKVPPDMLIESITEIFKKDERIKLPDWSQYLKAGMHREKRWENPDWFYRRLASTLRKISVYGPIGISRLSGEYGGRVDRGSKRYHPAKGSRFIVRHTLKTLEEIGYIKAEKRGRSVTPQGLSLLEKTSKELMKSLSEKTPELQKYL
jgi:small subunit ribosomal protein S19e